MPSYWKLRRFSAWGLVLSVTSGGATAAPPLDCPTEVRLLDPAFERLVREGPRCTFFGRHGTQHRLPLTSPEFGSLTRYWAQEMTGLDLAGEALDAYDASHPQSPSRKVPVGILDEGVSLRALPRERLSPQLQGCLDKPATCPWVHRSAHGASVGNLILGAQPIGSAARAHLTYAASLLPEIDELITAGALINVVRNKEGNLTSYRINELKTRDLTAKTVGNAVRNLSATSEAPRVINLSFGFGDGDRAPMGIQAMSEVGQRTILVQASGNSFPAPIDRSTCGIPGIKVGALNPDGLSRACFQFSRGFDMTGECGST